MNVEDADELLAEAIRARDEAARLVTRTESNLWVAERNRDSAQAHFDAMVRWVADRERVLRELTIANDGGHHPKENA